MSDLLAKYKAKAAAAKEAAQADTPPAPANLPERAPAIAKSEQDTALSDSLAALRAKAGAQLATKTSSLGANSLGAAYAGKARSAMSAAVSAKAAEVASAKASAEQVAIEAAKIEVPEEIFTLSTELTALTGFPAEQVSADLATLYQRIQADQPDIAGLLGRINTNMRQFEELAYLLTPEQLGLIFSGTMRVTNSQITTTKAKSTKVDAAKALVSSGLDLSMF